jgi:MULE transposase domain/SWIM zinc finger
MKWTGRLFANTRLITMMMIMMARIFDFAIQRTGRISFKFLNLNGQLALILLYRSLQRLKNEASVLHIDATYKLLWHGYPVLVAGFSDLNAVFHPTHVAVCKSEATEDFKFMFTAMKTDLVGFEPRVVVADCADAIHAAARHVFGNTFKRVTCWAHVIRNIDKKLNTIKNPETRQQIRRDIVTLQLAKSDAEFDTAKSLLLKKYDACTTDVTSFLEYFRQEYLVSHAGWYEGVDFFAPSTNNGLESTNNVIKSHYTLRERLPMHQFLSSLRNMVFDWSLNCDPIRPNAKPFAHKPTVNLKLQTAAYNWKREKPSVLFREDGSTKTYFVSSAGNADLKERDVDMYLTQNARKNWRKFDAYVKTQRRLDMVSISDGDWEKATCTCTEFLKRFICKHTLGIAIVENKFKVVPEAKLVPIGQKRKRGRPAKAKKALIAQ